jgi:hypothetical protein
MLLIDAYRLRMDDNWTRHFQTESDSIYGPIHVLAFAVSCDWWRVAKIYFPHGGRPKKLRSAWLWEWVEHGVRLRTRVIHLALRGFIQMSPS